MLQHYLVATSQNFFVRHRRGGEISWRVFTLASFYGLVEYLRGKVRAFLGGAPDDVKF
jgi:hypothetical protein